LGLLYLLDKKNGHLSSSYVPKNLVVVENRKLYKVNKAGMQIRKDVKEQLEEMVRAYDKDTGAALFVVSSAYRSYSYQNGLFNRYVEQDGLAEAERYSARPGTSQHQLGTAMDFGSITNEFAETKQGKWMYEHAWEHGFSLSFPKGYEPDTGFMWESWHFRYIGVEACKLQKKYFNDVQQFMLEFINLWKSES
jgi:D-alanyl-D-alanine carboxypeptidase